MGLAGADGGHVMLGHAFDALVRGGGGLEPLGLQAEEGLVVAQEAGQLGVAHHAAAEVMDAEEGRAAALGLDGHQAVPGGGGVGIAQALGQVGDGGRLEQGGQGQLAAELRFDQAE